MREEITSCQKNETLSHVGDSSDSKPINKVTILSDDVGKGEDSEMILRFTKNKYSELMFGIKLAKLLTSY